MQGAISVHLMPNPSKRGVKGASKAVLSSVSTTLQVSVALRAEAGFQASKVRPSRRYLGKQRTSRVPLDLVVGFTPSEELILTAPASNRRCPGKSISEKAQMADGPSPSAFV
eukprot:5280672-Amphidinium_carterae.1